MRALLAALPNEVLLDIVVGAVLTVLSYSSLAIVLLTATLASQGLLPTPVALGLVLGANLGSGLLAHDRHQRRQPADAPPAAGQPALQADGRAAGHAAAAAGPGLLQQCVPTVAEQVVLFHLGFNLVLAVLFIGFTGVVGRLVERWLPAPANGSRRPPQQPPRPGGAGHARRWPSAAPRARRCTRPTWSRPCCAACCRCCATTTWRWPSACARWTTPSTSSTARSSST